MATMGLDDAGPWQATHSHGHTFTNMAPVGLDDAGPMQATHLHARARPRTRLRADHVLCVC